MRIYQGQGNTLTERGEKPPAFQVNPELTADRLYEPSPGLIDAVNVALVLGHPLLLTGKPGCGKTRLAHSLAWELGLPLLPFQTKSTSSYMDLLYRYDTLRHFQDVQLQRPVQAAEHYIEYGPLGEAIRLSLKDQRSVVLIDEIDKAPRDLPNDILNEIDRMSFTVKETKSTYNAEEKGEFRPIVVLTSNQEKDLPEAFRRRCVFYYIELPDEDELTRIVKKRLPKVAVSSPELIKKAIQRFLEIRDQRGLDKQVSTPELISWIDLLDRWQVSPGDPSQMSAQTRDLLYASYTLLAKSEEDLKLLAPKPVK